MMKISIFLTILVAYTCDIFGQAPTPVGPLPNDRQVEWYHREIMVFFHFGINTFTGPDGVEQGDGTASPSIFNPTNLNCMQWVSVLKAAGITCGILVAKHADGFCNWPTAYTSYSIKYSPWENGKGDLVKEYTDACKGAGIKAGLYLAPYDAHEAGEDIYNYSPAYADYYTGELSELLRNYGPIWEIWWDGAGADRIPVNFYTRWADSIHTLQPHCTIFGCKDGYLYADSRWVGDESGHAGDPCWSTIDKYYIQHETPDTLNVGQVNGDSYIPAESDVSTRPGWFYHSAENGEVKGISRLVEIYCSSVGHNSVMLLNLPPDRRGLIYSTDSANVVGLHKWIEGTFKTNLAKGATITCLHQRGPNYSPYNMVDDHDTTYYATNDSFTTDTVTFHLHSSKTFDCLMLQEMITLGHRTTGWSVDHSVDGTNWISIPEATGKQCIGYKWIVRFAPITASYVRLRITAGRACPAISTFGIYKQPAVN